MRVAIIAAFFGVIGSTEMALSQPVINTVDTKAACPLVNQPLTVVSPTGVSSDTVWVEHKDIWTHGSQKLPWQFTPNDAGEWVFVLDSIPKKTSGLIVYAGSCPAAETPITDNTVPAGFEIVTPKASCPSGWVDSTSSLSVTAQANGLHVCKRP